MRTILLLLALSGAAAFDGYSTSRCLARGGRELNPLFGTRPSAVRIGLELGAMTGAESYAAEKEKHKHRKLTAVFLGLGRAAHLAAGAHNRGCQ